MDFALAASVAALVLKITDVIKQVQGGKPKDALTQVLAWVVGVGVVMLAAQTNWAGDLAVGGVSLAQLNLASQFFVGVSVASAGSVVYDYSPRPTPSLGESASG